MNMNRIFKSIGGGIGASLLPLVAFAQADLSYFEEFLLDSGEIINQLIAVLIGIAVIVFIWGMIKYVTAGADAEAKAAARGTMIYGIIAIFVIVSIWGLVEIVQDIFGVDAQSTPPPFPEV